MIAALTKSFQTAFDPGYLNIMLKAFLGSLALFGLLFTLTWYGLASINLFEVIWLERLIDTISWATVMILSWYLFPGAVIMILGFFIEDLVRKIEKEYYPEWHHTLVEPRESHVLRSFKFGILALTMNLAALPLILIFSFLPPLNIFIFISLNGYLLGREYFELTAYHRLEMSQIRILWKRNRILLIFSGMVIAFLFSIPVVNLFMPAVGAAFMAHTFHKIRQG